jgi:hypothetical protein
MGDAVGFGDRMMVGNGYTYSRLRACFDLEIRPRVVEYDGKLDVVTFVRISNIDRRNLTADMRSAISIEIYRWKVAQRNAEKQKAARAAQAHHGTEGGRGHKKPLTLNSASRVSEAEPKTRARDARGS